MKRNDDVDARESVISKKMLEAGYECCSSPESLRELLKNIDQTIEEKDVAVAIGCMARTYTNMSGIGNGSSSGSNWNVENFVTVMNELVCLLFFWGERRNEEQYFFSSPSFH